MSETNSKANLEFDFDLDIIKEEIKLEPYLDDMKSEFGDDILYNTEQKHNFNETNANISQTFGRNTRDETAVIQSSAHKVDKIKVETADTVNPFDEDLDIIKEEIKLEPYLDVIKSESGDNILYNMEQKHNFYETNVTISQNFGGNTRKETVIIESSVHETNKIKVETTDTVNPFEEDDQNKNKGKSFACDVCEFRTTRRSNLQTHKNIHLIKKTFICTVCPYTTTCKSNFERHLPIHTGEKPFACNLCEHKFVYKDSLKKHMNVHTEEKPFACNSCEYQSAFKNCLNLHIMTKHSGERPYVCNICGYRGVIKRDLKKHLNIHTGEKPFACTLCKYKSVSKGNLKTHMSVHTGVKPFACNLCEYRTITKSHLKLHMSIHAEEKPFACDLCKYKSATKRNLKCHMKIHGNEKAGVKSDLEQKT